MRKRSTSQPSNLATLMETTSNGIVGSTLLAAMRLLFSRNSQKVGKYCRKFYCLYLWGAYITGACMVLYPFVLISALTTGIFVLPSAGLAKSSNVMLSFGTMQIILPFVLAAARQAFGDNEGVTATVDGSVYKDTNWRISDVDVLVGTPFPVSLEQRLFFVECLKKQPVFHEQHVELGELAIHVTCSIDMDIVCSNTVEYGVRPSATDRFKDNAAASSVARAMKLLAHADRATGKRMKSYHLELLVLDVQNLLDASGEINPAEQQADGSLQLLLRVLAAVVDAEPRLQRHDWFNEVLMTLQV